MTPLVIASLKTTFIFYTCVISFFVLTCYDRLDISGAGGRQDKFGSGREVRAGLSVPDG